MITITTESSEGAPRTARSAWKAWVLVPMILGAAAGVFIAARTPSLYRSSSLIRIEPQRVPEAYVRSTTKIGDRLQTIPLEILSRTRLERIIEEFNVYAEERRSGLMEDVIENMRRHIEVNVEQGDAIRVGFVGTDRRTVMRVAERLAAMYIEENVQSQIRIADGTSQFLEASLEDVRRRLVEHDKRLRAARQKSDPEAETLAIEYDVLKTTFKDLFSKIQESRLAVALQRRAIGETLKLVDPARVPERPFSPDRRIYAALGAAIGFAAGLLLFFAWPRGLFRKKRHGVVVPAEA
jgi:uncharacterized protein involved in exopolysaccharide biosynthesis